MESKTARGAIFGVVACFRGDARFAHLKASNGRHLFLPQSAQHPISENRCREPLAVRCTALELELQPNGFMGTKNRTREDVDCDGLVEIDPFAYFMRGYEKSYP